MEVDFSRHVAIKALFGSHNYNLNTPSSDRDYKVFLVPNLNDLYDGVEINENHVSEEEDYSVHDIRKLTVLFWKSNINFLEIMFSQEHTIDPELREIYDRKEDLARMNLPYLWESCVGMCFQKMKNLNKPTEGTRHLVDQYGYNTKEAIHAFRVLDFLERYSANKFTNFQEAIWYRDDEQMRDELLGIKSGMYTEAMFRDIIRDKLTYSSKLKPLFKDKQPDENLKEWLFLTVKDYVCRRIVKEER